MSLERLPARADAASITEALQRDGACIVENLASAETMDQDVRELAPFIAATPPGPDSFAGHQTSETRIAGNITALEVPAR